MIGSLSYSVYSAVGIDFSKTCLWSFKYLTKTMISLGFCSSHRMYCFAILLDFLCWYLDSLCLAVVPKTAPKSSNYHFKFLVDDVYAGRLKHLPRPPRPLWLYLLVQPTRQRPYPPLLALDLLVSEAWVIFMSLLSQPLLPAADEAIYFSRVILVYLPF